MRTQLWTALLTGAAAVHGALAQNITVYGAGELPEGATETFLACLTSLETSYRVYVDSGMTVILPPGSNQTITLDGADSGLYDCLTISEVMTGMQLAVEDTVDADASQEENSIAASAVTYAWLLAQGAQGQTPIGTRPAANANSTTVDDEALGRRDDDHRGLAKRTHYHYYGYLSDYSACTDSTLVTRYGSTCYNHNQAYYGVRFENAFAEKILTMIIWPHHRCENGNVRSFTVAPLTVSACQSRTTYSYYGHYVTCKCT
ncbi:hypothetical protein ASPACDRAFT_1892016 [Aspergillus aculeatus ATCC 16872]|uniref:YHYH domain-containing protein n=1 Tax=Aspergillus aculeatus (strain ATCC 16872 / CBS 172.66 / WB 5094) TaxID=690307 RepID=A0A1L9WG96_ASPA1|nr:uncharacterized protein ASPACDRAFT_1892016 [Aspergillus aculeatus ATCC 16872]OJJ95125.1 hypothetical protein ASPACDRAFT_1892016 [Aspergillus aculeatus ATCC 16872]